MSGLDRSVDDAERVAQLEALERLKSAAAAAQAVVTADFVASQRAAQRAAGVKADKVGQGIAAQVGLARRDSPHRGSRYVGLAQALVTELPHTMAALRCGDISEWRATIVARETACLEPADRRAVDAELGPRLAEWGDRQVEAQARKVTYRLDPQAFMERTRGAQKHRRVTLRPAPDTMSRLTGFLSVQQGVAAYAALCREADRLRATGDPRSRDQVMADLMAERLTGQTLASATPVEVLLVMTEDTLFGGDEPADLVGGGPIPAPAARDLLRDPDVTAWLRRVHTRPGDGTLVAMDSTRREFPAPLRRLLLVRDRYCRTSWCGAPVRHADHVRPWADGGATSEANGQGLCEACNYANQAPGWHARPGPDGAGDLVETTTPTGHTYASRPPPLPGPRRPPVPTHPDRRGHQELDRSGIEEGLRRLLAA